MDDKDFSQPSDHYFSYLAKKRVDENYEEELLKKVEENMGGENLHEPKEEIFYEIKHSAEEYNQI